MLFASFLKDVTVLELATNGVPLNNGEFDIIVLSCEFIIFMNHT